MSKPICVTTTLPAVSQALVEINLDQIASQTKLIVRKTAGFHAEGFLLSLLQAVAEGHGSLKQIACNLAQTSSSRPLARQAIHYRMNERALNFLQETTAQLLAAKITTAYLPTPTSIYLTKKPVWKPTSKTFPQAKPSLISPSTCACSAPS